MGIINWQYVIDTVAACFGLYVFVSALRMKLTGEVGAIIATPEELYKCKDKHAFIQAIYKKMMVFGFIILLFGIFDFVNERWWDNIIVRIVSFGVFLAACGIFLIQLRKERDKHLHL